MGHSTGIVPDTLRGWCKQADIDAGNRPHHLSQAVRNLVDNAARHATSRVEIQLSADASGPVATPEM